MSTAAVRNLPLVTGNISAQKGDMPYREDRLEAPLYLRYGLAFVPAFVELFLCTADHETALGNG